MASKRGLRRRGCARKRWYETMDAALAVRHRMIDQGYDAVAVYRCRWCGRFHVGHLPGNVLATIAVRREAAGQL